MKWGTLTAGMQQVIQILLARFKEIRGKKHKLASFNARLKSQWI
jgi:hypothetical protein